MKTRNFGEIIMGNNVGKFSGNIVGKFMRYIAGNTGGNNTGNNTMLPHVMPQTLPRNSLDNRAISPVVGEMLMLTVVLILVALFAASSSSFIPSDREPSVNILVGDVDPSNHDVTLWHKGGDVVSLSNMKVIIGNGNERNTFTEDNFVINGDDELKNFKPGDYMTVHAGYDIRGEDITVVVGSTVVMYGRIRE